MAASGRSTTTVKGTDGNDYAYRQTIDSRYQTSADAKVTLERLFVPFAALSAVLAGYSFLVANPGAELRI